MANDFITSGDILRETRTRRHRFEYAIEKYGPRPRGRIGNARVWYQDDLPAIRESLARVRGLKTEVAA